MTKLTTTVLQLSPFVTMLLLLVIGGYLCSDEDDYNNDNIAVDGRDDEKTTVKTLTTTLKTGSSSSSSNEEIGCDGRSKVLTSRRGLIYTPNFPKSFTVPIRCRWIIDASAYAGQSPVVYVYFTQLYVTSGLTITEYGYYDVESGNGLLGRQIYNAVHDEALRYEFSRTNLTYLVIDFQLDVLEGNHLRVLYHLMDVYGFNITYEITEYEPRDKRCTVTDCSLVGHCYASYDFTSYSCSCFLGFSGDNCGYGPLCKDDMNSCQNGGTCRYAGETMVVCECTEGFIGETCNTPASKSSLIVEKSVLNNISKVTLTGHGKLAEYLRRFGLENGDKCPCGQVETARHILFDCPLYNNERKFNETNFNLKGCPETQNCTQQCIYDRRMDQHVLTVPCDCSNRVIVSRDPDRVKYALTLRFINLTAILDNSLPAIVQRNLIDIGETWTQPPQQQQLLEHKINNEVIHYVGKYFKKTKLSKLEHMEVVHLTKDNNSAVTITINFLALRDDKIRIKDAVAQMTDRNVISSSYHLSQLPALQLVKVSTNMKDNLVPEGEEFIISCIAEGSTDISFQLFKDNVPINVSIATRGMWSRIVQMNNSRYTLLLAIEHADIYDSGIYTCEVKDSGYKQCHSILVSVLQVPHVKLNPLSVSAEKGQNVSVKCLSTNEFYNGAKFGYTWLKNNNLVKASIPDLYWEDLYRGGSILFINNIQVSETFKCNVQAIGSRSVAVYIDVLNKTETVFCEKDGNWPATSAGVTVLQECPAKYSDDHSVSRLCQITEANTARWQQPDYSKCVSHNFSIATRFFRELLLGYQNTSVTGNYTLYAIRQVLRNRMSNGQQLFPGEGEPIVHFVQAVCLYLIKAAKYDDLFDASDSFYTIIDGLLHESTAIINEKAMFVLSNLIQKWTSFWMSTRNSRLNRKNRSSSNDYYYYYYYRSFELFRPTYFGQVLKLADGVNVKIEVTNSRKSVNNASTHTAIIVYKNLSQRLLPRYTTASWSTNNLLYELRSPIIDIVFDEEIERSEQFDQDVKNGTVGLLSVRLDYELPSSNYQNRNVCCGLTYTFGRAWKLFSCRSTDEIIRRTISCSYFGPGLIAIYAADLPIVNDDVNRKYHLVVLVGCTACFIQCTIALVVLIPRWYKIRSCLIYLKMQICLSTGTAMVLFLYASCNPPVVAYPYIFFGLQVFLLAAISSHISVLIVIYIDVISLHKIPKIKISAIVVMTVSPMLLTAFAPLSRQITNERLSCWWLCRNTLLIYAHSMVGIFLFVLFLFLYYSVMKKLWFLLNSAKNERKTLMNRLSFVQCTLLIFLTTAVVVTSSTVYVNVTTSITQCVFGSSSVLLGFLLAISYIPRNEMLICGKMYPIKFRYGDNRTDDKYSPELQIIPATTDLLYKQESCTSDSSGSQASCNHVEIIRRNDRADNIHMSSYKKKTTRNMNTIETSSTAESPVLASKTETDNNKSKKIDKPDILLPVTSNNYVTPGVCNVVANNPNVSSPEQITSSSSSSFAEKQTTCPEILTTRVCVELGVVKSSACLNKSELFENDTNRRYNDDNNNAGTLLICSVDVEPCPGHIVEVNEVKFTTIDTNAFNEHQQQPHQLQQHVHQQQYLNQRQHLNFQQPAKHVCDDKNNAENLKDDVIVNDVSNADNNGKDVLDRISQDLDYLLNRNNSSDQLIQPIHEKDDNHPK